MQALRENLQFVSDDFVKISKQSLPAALGKSRQKLGRTPVFNFMKYANLIKMNSEHLSTVASKGHNCFRTLPNTFFRITSTIKTTFQKQTIYFSNNLVES